MSSRKTDNYSRITAQLQVPFPGPELPHEAFANVREKPESLAAFNKRFARPKRPAWGELLTDTPRRQREVLSILHDFRRAWRGEEDAVRWVQHFLDQANFSFTVQRGQVTMEPKSLLYTICLLFLRDYTAGKTAICANPNCHSPYFIQKRRTQKYCMAGPCTEQAQREQKRLWWERHYGKGGK